MNIAIVGGSRGIGKAAAAEMAKDGHRLLIIGRKTETLDCLKREFPEDTEYYAADITNEADTENLISYITQRFPLDGLVLNAAAFPNPQTGCSVLEPSAEELSQILNANLIAHYRVVQKVFPLLKKSTCGKLVLIGSTAGVRRDKGGIYGISKWALRSFAYNLREEAKQYGIGVSLINPGGTFTETRKKQNEEDTHLLESADLGILIATVFRLSPQAVIEQLDVRPLAGDTY